MNTVNPQDFLVQKAVSSFLFSMDTAMRRVALAKDVMELVRAANARPTAPGYVSWHPDVKGCANRASLEIERKAKEVVEVELARLDSLFETASREEFQRALGAFQRDLRYVGPLASRVMRDASQHISMRYRFRPVPHEGGSPGVRQLSTMDARNRLNHSDLDPGDVVCLDSIEYWGEGLIAAAMGPGREVRSVFFHPGIKSYVFSDETSRLSQQYSKGSLRECILMFEREVGVTLPPIKVVWAGDWPWEAHGAEPETLPLLELEPGKVYEVKHETGDPALYVANEKGHVALAETVGEGMKPFFFDPKVHWTMTEWHTLRPVESAPVESPAVPRG